MRTTILKMMMQPFFLFFLLSIIACGKSNVNTIDDSEITPPGTDIPIHEEPESLIHIERAIFNSPEKTSSRVRDYKIFDSLVYYINHTPKDASIHMSTMLFYYEPIVSATLNALNRGAIVKVLMDGSEGNQNRNQDTYDKLMNAMTGASMVKWVYNDAKGFDENHQVMAINHEKLAIFSEVKLENGVAKNLVFVTSQNWKANGAEQSNNAVVITNKDLYNAFLSNWNAIEERASSGMEHFTYTVNPIGDSITAFFYPRRVDGVWDGKNTIIEQLDKLNNGLFSLDTIRVLMAGWSGNGLRIAERLTFLQSKGVIVEVIARSDSKEDVLEELEKLKDAGGYVKIINFETQGLHSKIMLISGMMDGEMQQVILTGSYNYSSGALKYNNEVILMLTNSILFKDYWNNWDEVNRYF